MYKEFNSIFHEETIVYEAKRINPETEYKNACDDLEYLVRKRESTGDKVASGIGIVLTSFGTIDFVVNTVFGLPIGVIFSGLEIIAGCALANRSKVQKLSNLRTKCERTIKKIEKMKKKTDDSKIRSKYDKNIEDLDKVIDKIDQEIRKIS